MRVLDILQRVVLAVAVALPVLFVVTDSALRAFNARPENEIVAFVRRGAETVVPEPFTTMFEDQQVWQTLLLALIAYALLAILIVAVFEGLGSAIESLQRRRRERQDVRERP